MIYYELIDNSGEIIYSTIIKNQALSIFENNKIDNYELNGMQHVYREYKSGKVRLIGNKSHASLTTTKIRSRTANTYAELIPFLKEVKLTQETDYNIFSHNLITTHSKLQDEIESIVPENELAKALTYNDQILAVKNNIEKNTLATSESIFEIAKRIIDLQAQITGFKILSGEIKIDKIRHNIKKVLLNIIYPYYEDFKKNEIEVSLSINDYDASNNLVTLDYKVFNIAMQHFLNNAVKYVMPNSDIYITFDRNKKELLFDMLSVRIEKNELDAVFEMKVSGINCKGLSGDGIGMFMIKKSLDLLNTKMVIIPDYSITRIYNKRNYVKNVFSILFV